MEYNIAVVKGDGIGPEIVSEAMLVLDKVGEVRPQVWFSGGPQAAARSQERHR
ncbi:MAG: hypothetical protein ACLVFS_00890 [Butyricicoccus sp.]